MNINQLEKLKTLTNDIQKLEVLVDEDDIVINKMLQLIKNLKDDDFIKYNDNFKWLVNYLDNINTYFLKQDNDIIEKIIVNSRNLSSTNRRNLLELYKKHEYKDIYRIFISNPNFNFYPASDIENFVEDLIETGLEYRALDISKYRNMKEMKEIISNYNDAGVYEVNYMIKDRTHEQSKITISKYKTAPKKINQDDDKIKLIKELFFMEEMYKYRSYEEHMNLIDKYYENKDNYMVIRLILNKDILSTKTYEEQISLIRILENNDFDYNIFYMFINLSKYSTDELFSIVGLYQRNKEFNIKDYVIENKNLSYNEFYEKLSHQISSVRLAKVIIQAESIKDIYDMLKDYNIDEFTSNTLILQKK